MNLEKISNKFHFSWEKVRNSNIYLYSLLVIPIVGSIYIGISNSDERDKLRIEKTSKIEYRDSLKNIPESTYTPK